MGVMEKTSSDHAYEFSYNRELLDSLVGKTILAVAVDAAKQESMRFITEDGETIVWNTNADCCSETWFSDVYNLNELRGAEVVAVFPLDLQKAGYPDPDKDGRTRQEHDQLYGYAVVTTEGKAVIAFRNSSNGYYGGSAGVASEPPAWVKDWETLTSDDWSA